MSALEISAGSSRSRARWSGRSVKRAMPWEMSDAVVSLPAGDHDEAEAEDVPVGEAFPFDLGGDQGADQVVGGFASACFDLLAEVAEHLGHRTLAVELSDAQAVVLDGGERLHPGPEAVAVLLGEAEELGEHVGGGSCWRTPGAGRRPRRRRRVRPARSAGGGRSCG
jgi:hypothetical protein